LIEKHRSRLPGKVVIDPSNPVATDGKGNFSRTLPDGVSAGSVVAALLPTDAHFVKAFGTLGAGSLGAGANRTPERAVLFYATDDNQAQAAVERLIRAAGFVPFKVGGVNQSLRIEMFGDLHDFGGLKGRLVDLEEARRLVAWHGRFASWSIVSGKVQVHEGVPGEVDARGAGATSRVAVEGQGGVSDADSRSNFAEGRRR
jgi:hypothetical protein